MSSKSVGQGGLTLVEVLIVVAIVGILGGLSVGAFRAPESKLLTNDINLTIQQARYEAIRRNHPVAVNWDPGNESLTAVVNEGNPAAAAACSGGTVVGYQDSSAYPNASFASAPLAEVGFVWLPSGQLRSCLGGVPTEFRLVVADANRVRTITLTPTGRVDIQ